MKILIQELVRGVTEVLRPEYREDIERELVDRRIPYTINYVNDFDTIDTIKRKVVSDIKS